MRKLGRRVPGLLLVVVAVISCGIFDLLHTSRLLGPRRRLVELDPAVAELLADGVLEVPPQEGCQHRIAPCGYQLLLLGFHNTRTSFSSRLINLMGKGMVRALVWCARVMVALLLNFM